MLSCSKQEGPKSAQYFADLMAKYERERYGDLSRPCSGQIWLVNDEVIFPDGRKLILEPDPNRPNMVVLMGFDEDFLSEDFSVARVLPISKQWIFACPHSLTFSPQTSPLEGIPFMVECWNPRPVLRINLLRAVAKLDELILEDIEYLTSCDLRGRQPKGYDQHRARSDRSKGQCESSAGAAEASEVRRRRLDRTLSEVVEVAELFRCD